MDLPSPAPRLTRALRHRNFRLFFFGQGTSLVGTWLTRLAIGYQTYALSHSAFQLGLVAFFSQAPTALIAPLGGVLVDRWDRHRTLIATQVAAMVQSGLLAYFALTNTMTVWHLLVLGAAQAVVTAFDMPARQSSLRRMVDDPADLANAIALNSSMVNAARLVGPVVAAALIAWVGIGGCYALDALSYVAVIVSLQMMRLAPEPSRPGTTGVRDDLRDGLAYVRGQPLVAALLVSLAFTSFCGAGYTAMLPAYAEASLHGDVHTLGWLTGSTGAGALVGALALARRETLVGLDKMVARAGFGLGAALIALELAPTAWVAMPILFVAGLSMMLVWAATNTLVQTTVPPEKLGRVMSLYAMAFFGGTPLGALGMGALASVVGPTHALALAGLACVGVALGLRAVQRRA